MHFGKYSYLVTTLLCAGGPLLLECFFVSWAVRYYRRVLTAVTLTMIVATWIWDSTGLAWGAWSYNPERTLGISLGGVPLETYLATILAAPAVAIATLAFADFPLNFAAASRRTLPAGRGLDSPPTG
jgi:lycopene cyclase domain-containing protein